MQLTRRIHRRLADGKAVTTLSGQSRAVWGMMREMERKVETMIASQSRQMREIRTLSPAED